MYRANLIFFLLVGCCVHANAQRNTQSQHAIADYLRQEVAAGRVVGAQVLVGSSRSRDHEAINLGSVGLADIRLVSDETVFCVASCSKPIAAALIFTLLDSKQLELDQPANALIPVLNSLTTTDGTKTRSPTLRELLAHRGGIYSQIQGPTKIQLTAIRDFGLSLDESVQIIAKQPLSSPPGTHYAYSGAGYILVGMMGEKASGKEFETLLQENICKPLRMNSTTYFPNAQRMEEIATGGQSQLVPPHSMGTELKLPLIGGSIYTTAKDFERFARMVLFQGRLDRKQVLSKTAWRHFVSPAFPTQDYGYGWLLTKQGNRVVALSHKGSLPPYQSAIHINLQDKTYKIVLWTLAKPVDVQSTVRIRDSIATLIK